MSFPRSLRKRKVSQDDFVGVGVCPRWVAFPAVQFLVRRNSCCVVRFSVAQGVREDGSTKVRAVDHFSWSAPLEGETGWSKRRRKESSVNGCTLLPEAVHHDHIDDLAVVMRRFREVCGEIPGLFKADIDAAFRRIPLKPGHRWAAAVAYQYRGETMLSVHRACPFGSCSAVYNWERVGAMLCTLGRRLLNIALLRYVDDYFAPERRAPCINN